MWDLNNVGAVKVYAAKARTMLTRRYGEGRGRGGGTDVVVAVEAHWRQGTWRGARRGSEARERAAHAGGRVG